jgi:hypothetical protein
MNGGLGWKCDIVQEGTQGRAGKFADDALVGFSQVVCRGANAILAPEAKNMR